MLSIFKMLPVVSSLLLVFTAHIFIFQDYQLLVEGADGDPLQDFCVADLRNKKVIVNGFPCKDSATTTINDFVFSGLVQPGNPTTSPNLVALKLGFVQQYPAVNTLGIGIARADFAKGGIIMPHTHPRATEILYLAQGSLYTGFITTDNKLYATILTQGQVMIYPRGLIHFQLNVGSGPAMAIVSLNSQNPGVQLVPNSLFGSKLKDQVLEQSFHMSPSEVDNIKSFFTPTKQH